ncbi:ScyD/ScyE family protein [Gramella sp. MT6]|uniref:ScyD/ScyE family protein n=1 Tax=Gramella sp. MT6 TaxID=2705471 RepID=UPI001C5D8417|nr:ScyD/ScyE family protein [Gramella sp. MT6]QYA24509.1 ScyD/ScyE family protein [Gramella sp. MT6]
MKNQFFYGVILLLFISIAACTNDKVITDIATEYESSLGKDPASLKAKMNAEGEFASPLFDLATAPNNDILVADAGQGITNIYGATEFALPGVTSVSTVGRGIMWATTGPIEPTEDTGQGIHLVGNGGTKLVANLFHFEEENDPDGAGVDSNPYSVVALNANSALVADSGANDLLRVDNKGNIEVVAIFPDEMVSTDNLKSLVGCPDPIAGFEGFCNFPPMLPAQAVPTSIVVGPDGYYYVSELKGFPAPTGASNIWRISPDASGAMCGTDPGCVKAFDGGFTSIIDMAFDSNGMLYVAEFDEKSWFAVEVLGTVTGGTIKACDPETMQCEVIASGIPILTSITFDKDGKLYATKNALIPGLAEVIEIQL